MGDESISRYADNCQYDHQRQLLWETHEAIIGVLPQYQVSLKWKVPCYSYIKLLCYLNCTKEHIYVSFFQGSQLSDRPSLDKTGTTMVAKYHIRSTEDILKSEFVDILLEAVALQESPQVIK